VIGLVIGEEGRDCTCSGRCPHLRGRTRGRRPAAQAV